MQNAFEIKGIRIGDGQPVICVPVVALKKEEVITNIRFLAEQKVQMCIRDSLYYLQEIF